MYTLIEPLIKLYTNIVVRVSCGSKRNHPGSTCGSGSGSGNGRLNSIVDFVVVKNYYG